MRSGPGRSRYSSANDPGTTSPAGSNVAITTPVVESALSTSFEAGGESSVSEELLSRPDDERKDPEAVLVDDARAQKRLDEVPSFPRPGAQGRPSFELRQCFRSVALEQDRVLPFERRPAA